MVFFLKIQILSKLHTSTHYNKQHIVSMLNMYTHIAYAHCTKTIIKEKKIQKKTVLCSTVFVRSVTESVLKKKVYNFKFEF